MSKLGDLFPNYASVSIFIAYMTFCVGQGILITASRTGESGYNYNTVAAVLFTEVVKLILASTCYLKDHTVKELYIDLKSHGKICFLYMVPSFLYCIYNNLAFVNLAAFDPTTYYLLLQIRVVVTGVLFQLIVVTDDITTRVTGRMIDSVRAFHLNLDFPFRLSYAVTYTIIFSRKLSGWQWFSLILLTSGCMLQQLDWDQLSQPSTSESSSKLSFKISFNLILILLQTACSCLAGVYNEYLLKGEAGNVNIFIQNIYMYVDSIIWNVAVLAQQGTLLQSISASSLATLLAPLVMILILNNALIGITTSLFLKNLNSILKTFASALELVFTAVLSYVFFGVAIRPNTWMAILVVSYAVYLYTKNPVVNKPVQVRKTEDLV